MKTTPASTTLGLFALCGLLLAPVSAEPPATANKHKSERALAKKELGAPIVITSDTSPEDEYSELCRQAREDDVAFQAKWEKSTPAERVALRSEQLRRIQKNLGRRNELAKQIAQRRHAAGKRESFQPIPVPAGAQPEDAIKGRSPQELGRLGVDVKKLHDRPTGQR